MPALDLAAWNARELKADVSWKRHDFLKEYLDDKDGTFDIIVSNPPYISRAEADRMAESTLRFEPESALFSDDDVLAFYRRMAEIGPRILRTNGSIYMEINEFRHLETMVLFEQAGFTPELCSDLQDKPRMIRARLA